MTTLDGRRYIFCIQRTRRWREFGHSWPSSNRLQIRGGASRRASSAHFILTTQANFCPDNSRSSSQTRPWNILDARRMYISLTGSPSGRFVRCSSSCGPTSRPAKPQSVSGHTWWSMQSIALTGPPAHLAQTKPHTKCLRAASRKSWQSYHSAAARMQSSRAPPLPKQTSSRAPGQE